MEDSVPVGIFVAVTVTCAVPVTMEVTCTINGLGGNKGDSVYVGDAIVAGKEVAVATTGAGVMAIPAMPISTNANPLIELIIKSLGYFIRVKQPYYYTIHQFAVQVEIIIGSLSTLGTDHDFV